MDLTATFPVCLDDVHPTPVEGESQEVYYDLTPCVSGQDLDIWHETIHYLPSCHPTRGPWILGGAVRRFFMDLPQSADIDLFFSSSYDLNNARVDLSEHYQKIMETPHHLTYHVHDRRVQLVRTRYQPTMIDHMNLFDFTLCQTGWDGQRFLMSESALHALTNEILQINPLHPTPLDLPASWNRILKYVQYGYLPDIKTIHHFIECAQALPTLIDKGQHYA